MTAHDPPYVNDLLERHHPEQFAAESGSVMSGSATCSTLLFPPPENSITLPPPSPVNPQQRPPMPRIDEINPNEGDVMGGTTVDITGADFPPGLQFYFEHRLATNTRRLGDILYKCRSPARDTPGAVQVRFDRMPEAQPAPTFTYVDAREKDL